MNTCEYCGEEINGNKGVLKTHLKVCKENPSAIRTKCKFCGKTPFFKWVGLKSHENNCPENPNLSSNSTRRRYQNESPICEFCNSPLTYQQFKRDQKYCSVGCANSDRNFKPGPSSEEDEEHTKCVYCGEETTNPKYCSLDCFHDERRNERAYKIEETDENVTHRTVKRYLISENGHKCSKCGRKEWQDKKIPIEIDHIDGDFENNNLDNVRLLCCNCHALTDTYKGKNKGQGRKYRKEYYSS